jgi:hexulose-6-phosphate isomerase
VRIGIMQGRLLPPFEGRFQGFPADRWREEFPKAQQAGLASIEWIYEVFHEQDNPLGADDGIAEIQDLGAQTGVQVRSICADYYMQAPLIVDGQVQAERVEHLEWLLTRARKLGCWYVILPFVDQSSLATEEDRHTLASVLRSLAPAAEAAGVELHLETDLPPKDFLAVLTAVGHPMVKANYDIGNSASLGFDPVEELTLLGPRLGSVHVKDRRRGGGTVPLGTGDADLPTCLRMIRAAGYDRPYIMQVARGPEGDETAWAQANRRQIEQLAASV